MCTGGLGTVVDCPGNLHFSIMREQCVDPEEANCVLPGNRDSHFPVCCVLPGKRNSTLFGPTHCHVKGSHTFGHLV